jgi:hypothetical protein
MIRLEYLGADAGFGLLTGILLPHPTITTAININKVCFMPATLRLTSSGVNAVGGKEEAEGVSVLLFGVVSDFALRQCLLQFLYLI